MEVDPTLQLEELDDIRCMKCKANTPNNDIDYVHTSTGRPRIACTCAICGTKKSKMLPMHNETRLQAAEAHLYEHIQNGGSLVNWLIEHNPVELHVIDQGDDGKIRRSAFDGPGTNLNKRLNPDSTWKDWSKPINALDLGAYHHDLAYREFKDVEHRNVADKALAEVAKSVMFDPTSTKLQRFNASMVYKIMNYKISHKK